MRAAAAKFVQHRQQVKAGVFVGGEQQTAAVERTQLVERVGRLVAKRQQPLRIVAQQLACLGERAVARSALKKDFAKVALEFADDLAYRRLGPVQSRRRAGEAALLGYGQKCFKLK